MSKYLLEIGTEELPHKFIKSGIAQLKANFEKLLNENKIGYSGIKTYSTPRRLALIIDGLAQKQPDTEKLVKGPVSNIAYKEDGSLSPAGMGFAKKNGVSEKDLFVQDNYVWAKISVKGKDIAEVLKENAESTVLKLQGPYFMRWAALDVKFQRPIRWVVSLLDDEEVKIKIAEVESGRFSRGHRFKSSKVEIKNPDCYEKALYEANVMANQEERKKHVVESAKKKAAEINAEVYLDDDLVEEVTNLCEWPVPVICGFDEKYLAIPEKVTVTVMAVHQRYFPMYKDGKLLNKFITMTNYIGDDFENIKAGNERVVVARLDDAIFFFNEDTKKPFADNVEKLKGITFQKGMGSVYDKTMRIIELSKYLCDELKTKSRETIERTALLCKADLVTSLVFEFTELQGFIGADYALNAGEKPEVVQGIKEHYFPLGADSELAESIEGQVVGIADKIDTICAVFAEGKKPTGSADPLGVRRATLGIIKTVIQKSLNINLEELIKKSVLLLPSNTSGADKTTEDVKNFFEQRLNILCSEQYPHDVVEACIANKSPLADLRDFTLRLDFVSEIVKEQDFAALNEAANRIIRLIKDKNVKSEAEKSLFTNEYEEKLYEGIQAVKSEDYKTLYAELKSAVPSVNSFFDNVLVMDKDEKIKENRMALINSLKLKFDKIADFSKIAG